jgi:rod shape determining protein RodA
MAVRSDVREKVAHLDVSLVACAMAIASIGVVMVYSATRAKLAATGADPRLYLKHQLAWVVLGVGAMATTAAADYRRLRDVGVLAYGAVVLALLLVMSPFGSSALGSQRWFPLGPFQFQPSAFVALTAVVAVAAYLWRGNDRVSTRQVLVVLTIVGVPMLLVAAQPDLGTALVLAAVGYTLLVVQGTRGRVLAVIAVIALVGTVGVLKSGTLKRYQVDRLTAFADPSNDGARAAYNLSESKIAIANGGLLGRGLFHGSQTNLAYVPEQSTDFIFTAVGEQLGLVGSVLVLALYGFLSWRLWRAARVAADHFGMLLCTGVLALFVIQIFENTGMTMGIMPITGIPLPLMSYGGSSTIAFFVAIGLVLSVRRLRFR